jgi:L(+)-tartrate dehydratase alpha subunit
MAAEKEMTAKMTDIMAQFVGFTAKKLPDDVIAKLQELRDKEDSPMAKVIYDTMFRNQELAVKLNRPSCQDTGALQFWVKCGTKFPLIDDVECRQGTSYSMVGHRSPLRRVRDLHIHGGRRMHTARQRNCFDARRRV